MKQITTLALLIVLSAGRLYAQALDSSAYPIGSPDVRDYYVDPANGDDDNDGTSRSHPKKTVSAIWNDIPQNSTLSTGYRINLLPGTYGTDHLPNYWDNRRGTASHPIILTAADGFGTVSLTRDINMADVSYFYLLGVDIKNRLSAGYGDAFHCESCDHILLRGNSFNGAPNGRNAGGDVAHETIKFNQSQYVYIENNNIQGADDNGIDWVAVQYGVIRGNRIHDTQGWCMYTKGGSSYILVEANIAYDCGEGGITAGQGTGFEFMVSPWLRYEANYIKIVNNVIHDIQGAAIGINGGFDILVAHNTAYRVGQRSHLLEVVWGSRSCDGDTSACASRRSVGGWGPQSTGDSNAQNIGNRNVLVFNNIFFNPSGYTSGSQHFTIFRQSSPTVSGIPNPQEADNGLVIKGNIISNGDSSMPLGIGDDSGCQPSNPTCNETQLLADNRINSLQPDFINASDYDFRPIANGTLAGTTSSATTDFAALDSSHNPIPEGNRSNTMSREFSGAAASTRPPGAFVSSNSSTSFPSDSGETPNGNGGSNVAPTVSNLKLSAKRTKGVVTLKVSAVANDDTSVSSVKGAAYVKTKKLKSATLRLASGRYSAQMKFKSSAKTINVKVTAKDGAGLSKTATKNVKVK